MDLKFNPLIQNFYGVKQHFLVIVRSLILQQPVKLTSAFKFKFTFTILPTNITVIVLIWAQFALGRYVQFEAGLVNFGCTLIHVHMGIAT